MDAQKEKDQQEFDAKLKAWSKQIKKLDKREGVQLENTKVKSAKHCIEDKHVSLKGYNPHEIREGIEEEHEHTSNLAAKKQMVHDHLKSDPKYYTHLDEMETKHHTEKDHMKEAFERGFMKAAMAHGVEPRMAVELLKYAAPSMTQLSNDRTPSEEDMYSPPLLRDDHMNSLFPHRSPLSGLHLDRYNKANMPPMPAYAGPAEFEAAHRDFDPFQAAPSSFEAAHNWNPDAVPKGAPIHTFNTRDEGPHNWNPDADPSFEAAHKDFIPYEVATSPSTYDHVKGTLQNFGTNTLPKVMDNMSTNVIPRVGDYMKTNHIPEKMDNFRTNTLPNLHKKMMSWLKP